MGKGLAKFFVRANGPASFRLGLRQRTRPVRTFSTVFAGINGVSTRISETVLGGDILELMSSYLRRLIQHSEESRSSMSAALGKRGFADGIDTGSDSIAKSEDLRAIDRQSRNPFALNATESIDRSPFNSISGAAATRTENLLPRSATTTARRAFEPLKRTESGNWSIAGKGKRIRQSPSAPLPGSRLSTGLQEYWQSSKHQQSIALHEDGPRVPTSRGATGFSQTSPTPIFPERSLAELTGQPLLDKIDALTAGLAPRKAGVNQQATNNPDSLSHVEIQNTFHVEVKNEPGGPGSLGDLSDKVADILREQALQHGIDIT